MSEIVSFRRMEDGTQGRLRAAGPLGTRICAKGLPDSVLASLRKLDHSLVRLSGQPPRSFAADGDACAAGRRRRRPGRGRVDPRHRRRTRALQSCTEIAAGIIRPYVRPEVTWIVETSRLVSELLLRASSWAAIAMRGTSFIDHPWYRGLQGISVPTMINVRSIPNYAYGATGHLRAAGSTAYSRGRRTMRATWIGARDGQLVGGRRLGAPGTSAARRWSERRIRYPPASSTQPPTAQMMRLARALTSGLTPSFTFEKMTMGRVLAPGARDETGNDQVIQRQGEAQQPARGQRGRDTGQGGVDEGPHRACALESMAASSNDRSALCRRDCTVMVT